MPLCDQNDIHKHLTTTAKHNYCKLAFVTQDVTQKMIMDDIQGEMNAIAEYKKMLFVLKNEDVAAIIQRIIIDEQLHLETLKNMLNKLNG